jgi:hypothetical protein
MSKMKAQRGRVLTLGKVLPGSVDPGDKNTVSISANLTITYVGVLMMRPVASCLMIERFLGREGESLSPSVKRIIYLRTSLGFFKDMRSRALPYFRRLRLQAWRMRCLVTLLRPSKQAWILS